MKKGLLIIMMSNLVNLLVGLISNFFLPKFLSFDSYAIIKTYSLYMTYSSFFSLGYVDGMYLEYGGKNYDSINKVILADEIKKFALLELFFFSLIVCMGLLMKSPVVLCFAIGLFTNAITGCFRSLFQATGEFRTYGNSMNAEKITLLICYFLLLFVFRTDSPYLFIGCQVVIPGILFVYFLKFTFGNGKINLLSGNKTKAKQYVASGFVLMISNFSLGLLTGIDRWFVKMFMDTTSFAIYSFAVSTESVISVFLSPISVSMYNYFCREDSIKNMHRIKNMTVLWTFVIIAAAFPCKWILYHFLDKYILSANLIFLLFASQIFTMVVRGIYVNIYKVERKQNKYLVQVIISIMVAAILNSILYYVFSNMEAIALGTLITSIFWMLFCECEYPEQRFKLKEYFYITIMITAFLILTNMFSPFIGLMLYCAIYMLFSFLFMWAEFIDLIKFVYEIFCEKILYRKYKS